ncbi:MAG: 30S ribosomal protein S4 [Methanobacteriaceae archaeon]|nr:30S ribosomal protein S4 [Methanobacteriaceae archaeon]
MGHPKKPRKQYNTPSHPWIMDRIKEDNKLIQKYGLKNKKEVWKADSKVKRYRRDARVLLGTDSEEAQQEGEQLLNHLVRMGILSPNAKLEEVLEINVEDVLRRRLQSLVHRKGLSRTVKEARLFIIHGHITLNGKKINAPGYLVPKIDEDNIGFYPGSPVERSIVQETETKEETNNDADEE